MEFEIFGFIVVVAVLTSFLMLVLSKNKDLKKRLSQNEKKHLEPLKSPIPGFSQEVWNQLSEKILESSDEYILLFDEKLRLRLWNKTAGGLYQFEQGLGITELEKALSLESKPALDKSLKQLSASPGNIDDELQLKWKSGKDLRTKMQVVVDAGNSIQAVALAGVHDEAGNSSSLSPDLKSLLSSVEEPVLELKLIDGELDGVLEGKAVDKNQLLEIKTRQKALVEAVQSVLDFYKGHGAKLDLSESTVSASANALLRSLSMVVANAKLPMELSVTKQLQMTDSMLLIQASNFQRLVIDLVHFILSSSTASRAHATLDVTWEQTPMEATFLFSAGMTQLGQSIGSQWMKSCLENKAEFIRFESKLASLSCGLEAFEKSGDLLVFKIVVPRDIS